MNHHIANKVSYGSGRALVMLPLIILFAGIIAFVTWHRLQVMEDPKAPEILNGSMVQLSENLTHNSVNISVDGQPLAAGTDYLVDYMNDTITFLLNINTSEEQCELVYLIGNDQWYGFSIGPLAEASPIHTVTLEHRHQFILPLIDTKPFMNGAMAFYRFENYAGISASN